MRGLLFILLGLALASTSVQGAISSPSAQDREVSTYVQEADTHPSRVVAQRLHSQASIGLPEHFQPLNVNPSRLRAFTSSFERSHTGNALLWTAIILMGLSSIVGWIAYRSPRS